MGASSLPCFHRCAGVSEKDRLFHGSCRSTGRSVIESALFHAPLPDLLWLTLSARFVKVFC